MRRPKVKAKSQAELFAQSLVRDAIPISRRQAGPDSLLRIKDVCARTKLSRSTIRRLELAGKFPKREQISKNAVAWRESDVAEWIANVAK